MHESYRLKDVYCEGDRNKCEEWTSGRLVSGYCRSQWMLLLVDSAGADVANVIVALVVSIVVVVRPSVRIVGVGNESMERY